MTEARRVRGELERGVEEVVRRVQLASMRTLPAATPEDTGFARGSWTPTVGRPFTGEQTPPADRDAATAAGQQALRVNQARARNIARGYQLRQGNAFITSNVPYMVFLNMGSSSQAAAMFVERAITRAILNVGRVRI